MNNVENLQKIEKAADQGITTKDIQESKDVIADDAARKQFVDYCKDAKNNINMKECLLPSLQNIINDPTADKETKALASKLHRALVGNRIMRDIDPNQAQYKNVIMSKDSKGEWILKKIDENKKLVDIDPVKDAELRNQYYRKDDKGEITMIYKDTERFMLHSPRLNSDPKLIERGVLMRHFFKLLQTNFPTDGTYEKVMSGNTYHIEKTNTSAEFPHYTIQKTSPEKETITATIEEVWSAKSQSNKPLDALEFAKNMLEDFTTNKSSQEHIGGKKQTTVEKNNTKEPVTDENAQKLQAVVEADPKLVQDPQKAEILQNLKKELEKNPQDIASLANAVRGAWQYLSAMFFGKEWNAKTELGFKDFDAVRKMLHETLGKNLTPDQLQKALTDIIALAKRETNTKKKIGYVYGKSRLEDQLKVLEKSSLSTFDLLAQHLHVGDVLLLNKEDAGMGGKLLQRVSQSDIDATHTVVITNESPLQFSHSTEHRTNGTGAGVEYNVDLKTYLQSNSADVIQLETTNAMKENAKKYIANKTGEEDAKNAKYDYLAAVGGVAHASKSTADDKYNCVEYVSKVLGLTERNYTIPNEFLTLTDIMTPQYMTTINKGSSFSGHDLLDQFTTPIVAPAPTTDNKPAAKTTS